MIKAIQLKAERHPYSDCQVDAQTSKEAVVQRMDSRVETIHEVWMIDQVICVLCGDTDFFDKLLIDKKHLNINIATTVLMLF